MKNISASSWAVQRFHFWMAERRLGRKRILDTMLAATFEDNQVYHIITPATLHPHFPTTHAHLSLRQTGGHSSGDQRKAGGWRTPGASPLAAVPPSFLSPHECSISVHKWLILPSLPPWRVPAPASTTLTASSFFVAAQPPPPSSFKFHRCLPRSRSCRPLGCLRQAPPQAPARRWSSLPSSLLPIRGLSAIRGSMYF